MHLVDQHAQIPAAGLDAAEGAEEVAARTLRLARPGDPRFDADRGEIRNLLAAGECHRIVELEAQRQVGNAGAFGGERHARSFLGARKDEQHVAGLDHAGELAAQRHLATDCAGAGFCGAAGLGGGELARLADRGGEGIGFLGAGFDQFQEARPVLGGGCELLAVGGRSASQQQRLRFPGVDPEGTFDQFARPALQAAALGLCEDIGVVGEQGRVLVDQGSGAFVGLRCFRETFEHLVRPGQHHPALVVVGVLPQLVDEAVEHGLDLFGSDARLPLQRVERARLAEQRIAGSSSERDEHQQGQSGLATAAVGGRRRGRRGHFFEQTALQFAFRLGEIGLGERTIAALAFEFGELVTEYRQVRFALAGVARKPWRAQQRWQEEGDDGDDQQGRGDEEGGHACPCRESCSCSSASARPCSSALRGWSLIARSRRRR
ncbi:MAG: hypothetical protein AW09_003698 [Candidatus Accumulibacter phosphatis]|uniref:Uncharacterized protein n=1 Tax=Candidatus Accumulibacter phosphatis TaxID=327160 RepID=A0A080M1Z8_9PROT|nr:MAG: hypothetical protein AW09_003698 [Candidatus Accumulibacter phosphatis]